MSQDSVHALMGMHHMCRCAEVFPLQRGVILTTFSGWMSLCLTSAGNVFDAAEMASSLVTLGTGFTSAEAYPFKELMGFRVSTCPSFGAGVAEFIHPVESPAAAPEYASMPS